LPAPKFAFAGQEAVAEDELEPLVVAAFGVVFLVLDEDVLNLGEAAHEDVMVDAEAKADDVAVSARSLLEKLEGVAPGIEKAAEKGDAARTRCSFERESGCLHDSFRNVRAPSRLTTM
jgi:hypothetical protein